MNKTNPKADEYFCNAKNWQEEMEHLRKIVLDCPLVETFKWKSPCYTFQNSNVVIIGAFKDYCALSFFKGALLKDVNGILSKPGENTQAGRLIRFNTVKEIVELEPILKAYIHEAIEMEKAGLKVEFKKSKEPIPEEFQNKMDEDPSLKMAFDALTPGRQRGYLMYFSGAKQSKTREARIEKCKKRILDGKGLNDCICGLSRKLPNCDGSHKQIQ